jgi:glycosyltransferase involved in cell wall biosynthesis
MVKINLISSDFLGTSGYGVHTRNLANALHEIGAEVRIECPKPDNWTRFVTDAELLMATRELDKDYISILIGQPQWINVVKADNPRATGVFVVWEGDKVPFYWLNHLQEADFILVPSTHVLDAIKNTAGNLFDNLFKDKIFIVPHGVDFAKFPLMEKKKDRPFTFLFNKGWRGGLEDRSGLQYLLQAYDEEFTKADNVRLLVHINPAYLQPGFNITEELKKIGVSENENRAPILISLDNIPENQLANLYSEGDVFVCPTRAEGFNIAGLEAKATGMPNIQTAFGGQLDYMNGYDMGVTYELAEVKNDIQYEGIKWAVPNIDNLKLCMREMYNKRDILNDYSSGIRKSIENFTWHNAARKLIEAIKEKNLYI